MSNFRIRKGKNIKLKGAAERNIVDISLPHQLAVQPQDFPGLKPRLAVKVGDVVKVGSPILIDKDVEGLKVVSPASGKVAEINRGEKRALLSIVIETDGNQESESFQKFTKDSIATQSREDITNHLLNAGLWPIIRQRPFSKIAKPHANPKAIFVHAMNTEPLAPDLDFILENSFCDFQAGLDVLKKLTDGEVHLCIAEDAKSKALTEAKNVQTHRFAGAHPTGNVSTHMHYVDPVHKGDFVWYVEVQDVLRIAALFLEGQYPVERLAAVTGEGVKNAVYVRTHVGAPVSSLLQGSNLDGMRCISGSILTGKDIGAKGFLRFYDAQVTIIPEGGKRELLGWLVPGFKKYTFSKTFASAFLPGHQVSLDTDTHGSDRAIVVNNVYDSLNTLEILPYFLLKAVISENIEDAEALGILECDEEDFALCTFACPSKTDVGGIIRQGLEMIEKEG